MNFHGHFWTIAPTVRSALLRAPAPASTRWTTELEDPHVGVVRLSGRLSDPGTGDHVVVLVHGLGGSAERAYVRHAALAASSLGVASLRLNLRGADLSGDDIHHAGLVEDVAAALASRALARFDRITLFGFSLGGHTCLRYAALNPDPRLRAVAALCSPIDLGACTDAFDSARFSPYRPYVLGALRAIHRATVARGRAVLAADATRSVRTIRGWDELVITSRFGFANADAYYRAMSVVPLLGALRVPALYVGADHDPMVPKSVVAPFLMQARSLDVRWLGRGGHIGFPRGVALDVAASGIDRPSVDAQILRWLAARAA